MKRLMLCLLALLLLAGCAAKDTTVATVTPTLQAQDTQPAAPIRNAQPEALGETVVVDSVDGFLEAIASGNTIVLEPGCYDLTTASNYGTDTGSLDYYWARKGNDYELTLTTYDLTIQGAGREAVELVTRPRYVNVLAMDSCYNVQLAGFTAGHTEGGECAGGVIYAKDCEEIGLKDMSLFGCGTIGLTTEGGSGITLRDSEVYDCSYSGVYASQTENLEIRGCSFHNIGDKQWGGAQVFYLTRCKNASVTDCTVTECDVACLVLANPGAGVELRDTAFVRNRVESAVFAPQGSGLVMDGCAFEENTFRRWFEEREMTILDGVGKTWTEEMLEMWYNPPVGELPTGDRSQVEVSTVDALMAAIAPDTEIILADGLYDLSKAKGYGQDSTDYYFWSEEFDGPSLVLTGVNNLVIRSESGDVGKCTISAVPRYANVLSFRNCSNIALSGFTAGHTVEPGYCMGGVLDFENSDTILVENCGLYGCGILGIQADVCSDITVRHCDIYECSYGGIRMSDVSGVAIENCLFRDLGGDSLYFHSCKNVTVNGKSVSGNEHIQ